MRRLVIVESPTKARTIKGFLPEGYTVEACMGHVRDLPASAKEIPAAYKDRPWSRIGVDVENSFEPLYVIPNDKKSVIKDLKAKLKTADELILATDEDREGESIGWHLTEVLKPQIPMRRMVFHEITREAIDEALRNTRQIDQQLVRAQETRRILDRLVGYTVSPLLWKKIASGLSAGRVQSVAMQMLVQRERERLTFRSGAYWDLKALLQARGQRFSAILVSVGGRPIASGKDFDETTGQLKKGAKVLLLDEAAAKALRERLLTSGKDGWRVTDINERIQRRRPPAPFITSTLQQEANRKLRLSSKETMRVAQRLYEQGYITYMRTDSVHLSGEAINAARAAVVRRYGKDYLSDHPRQYTTKSKAAQEAHEAIRPAGNQMLTADEHGLSGVDHALYDMIWKRTIATQMADAVLKLNTVLIQVQDAVFQASGKTIVFPGYFRAYVEGSDDPEAALDDQEELLPPLVVGEVVECKDLQALRHETKPPARYTEASLVQALEREGVGRPSTYSTIISTILERGYVQKTANQLIPTYVAFAVSRLLEAHFPDLVDTQFTARMEEILDEIAEGRAAWLPYLQEFYSGEEGLEARVKEKEQTINPRDIYAMDVKELDAKIRIGRFGAYIERENGEGLVRVSLPETIAPADLTLEDVERLLRQKDEGPDVVTHDPKTGEPIYLLQGPYGYYLQVGQNGENDAKGGKKAPKPRRAPLPKGVQPEQLTPEMAIGLLSLPRTLGVDPASGAEIQAGIGRFGPYVRRGDVFKSLTKDDDVLTVSLERALELLSKARAEPRTLGEHPADGRTVLAAAGRYGPYVKHGRTNVALPKNTDLATVTLEQALALLAQKPARSSKPGKASKAARAKSAASKSRAASSKTRQTRKKSPSASPKKVKSK
jgi:DNA topoisomerase-1